MAYILDSVEEEANPNSDPYDWSVDDVVANVCDPQSPLRRARPQLYLPENTVLEAKLRENDVTGLAFLRELNTRALKDDLGLSSLGHRASLQVIIEILRKVSTKFEDEEVTRVSSIATRSMYMGISPSMPRYSTFHNPGPPPEAPGPWQSPLGIQNGVQNLLIGNGSPLGEDLLQKHQDILSGAHSPLQLKSKLDSKRDMTPMTLQAGRLLDAKLRTASLSSLYLGSPFRSHNGHGSDHSHIRLTPENIVEQNSALISEDALPSSVTKEKKRIAPINLVPLAPHDRSLQMTRGLNRDSPKVHEKSYNATSRNLLQEQSIQGLFPSKDLIAPASPALESPATLVESVQPRELQVDDKGRKRLTPICIHPKEGEAFPAAGISPSPDGKALLSQHSVSNVLLRGDSSEVRKISFGNHVKRRPDLVYLGLPSSGVDTIFYGETKLGEVVSTDIDSDSVNFNFSNLSPGRSGHQLYMNRRMKYYLRSEPFSLTSKGKEAICRIRYPDRLTVPNHPSSITVFSDDGQNDFVARRLNRQGYVEDESKQFSAETDDACTSNPFRVKDPCMAVDEVNARDWMVIEKWHHIDGHDDVLPKYGDSGSDGEYDLETWKEMEKDSGQLERPLGRKRNPLIQADLCENIIAQAVADMIEKWTTKTLPLLQHKAWRVWMRAKRDKTRKLQISDGELKITDLSERLVKLRKNIIAEEWSSEKKLLGQCKILEPTVVDLEKLKWHKGVLESSKAPQKLPPLAKTRPNKEVEEQKPAIPLADGEEEIASQSDHSTSAEDSLNDFVSDGEDSHMDLQQLTPLDDDLSLADIEDEAESLDISTVRKVDPFEEPSESSETFHGLPIKPSVPKTVGSSLPSADVIDLTQMSSDLEPTIESPEVEHNRNVKTPPILSSDENIVWKKPKSRPVFNKAPPLSQPQDVVINLDTTSTEQSDSAARMKRFNNEKPDFLDVDAIACMDELQLVEKQDRRRLLIWIVHHTLPEMRGMVIRYLHKLSMEVVQGYMKMALKTLSKGHARHIRRFDRELSGAMMQLAAWLVAYTIPLRYTDTEGLGCEDINTTIEDLPQFQTFYDFLLECIKYYQPKGGSLSKNIKTKARTPQKPNKVRGSQESQNTPQGSKRRKIVRLESELEIQDHIPGRKRVYEVAISQETLGMRKAARERMQKDQDRRRKELQPLPDHPAFAQTDTEIVVNPGKLEEQEFIRLDPSFGNGLRLKPHQVEGLQFLWREITADPDDLQGCLLAHTMGLGKTIQVIALLVALACAGSELNENIRDQVPLSLRESFTLILCPPALVENWYDELLVWIPETAQGSIGPIRKINSSTSLEFRVEEMRAWDEEGGILLMSYSIFRSLIDNKPNEKTQIRALDDEAHQIVKTILLSRTKLVVADEAHELKNKKSVLSRCVNQIKTKSRVALTGSPLSNNLSEYYALVDWISPKFLGDQTEFRAHYEEPISEGLCQDATEYQYRSALKKLKSLQLEMDPKVHRADFSVLHKSLHGKKEFLIKLPLTPIQRQLYEIFVDLMFHSIGDQQMKLFACLRNMQLLCHHPKVYHERLLNLKILMATRSSDAKGQKNPIKAKTRTATSNEQVASDEGDEMALINDVHASAAVRKLSEETQKWLATINDLDDLELSYKMSTTMVIIGLCMDAKDKVLVFSHRPDTLDYVASQIARLYKDSQVARIDGEVQPQRRQAITKDFNEGSINICLVSTGAGGIGLNLFGANRVIILDEWFNPMFEQQAIGRAYRIGQLKTVFVYRITMAGTFEEVIQKQGLFKTQLAARVVDQRNIKRSGVKKAGQYLFNPKVVKQQPLADFCDMDPEVLHRLLSSDEKYPILSITSTESFHVEDTIQLSPEDLREAQYHSQLAEMRRRQPAQYAELMRSRTVANNVALKPEIKGRTETDGIADQKSQIHPSPKEHVPTKAEASGSDRNNVQSEQRWVLWRSPERSQTASSANDITVNEIDRLKSPHRSRPPSASVLSTTSTQGKKRDRSRSRTSKSAQDRPQKRARPMPHVRPSFKGSG